MLYRFQDGAHALVVVQSGEYHANHVQRVRAGGDGRGMPQDNGAQRHQEGLDLFPHRLRFIGQLELSGEQHRRNQQHFYKLPAGQLDSLRRILWRSAAPALCGLDLRGGGVIGGRAQEGAHTEAPAAFLLVHLDRDNVSARRG